MFFPQEMTEVELIVPEKDLLTVTRLLSEKGLFHQADGTYLSTDKGTPSAASWSEKAAAYSGLERRIQTILQILGAEEGRPAAQEYETTADLDTVRPVVEHIEHEVKLTSDKIAAQQKQLEQLENTLRQLDPVAGIGLDISLIRNPRYLFSTIGMMPVENMERLQTSLSRVPYVFLPLSQDNKRAVVWLVGGRKNADVLERAARSAYLNPLVLPDNYQGTPAEIIAQLRKEIQNAHQEIAELKKELARQNEVHHEQLQSLLWEVRASRMMTDAIVRYGKMRYTYLIVGWLVSSAIPEFTRKLKLISRGTVLETIPTRRDEPNQEVPVSLGHRPILRPFQMLVTTYAQPRYDEVDPTLLMTITFPLLFGAMFGDIGHGLLLAGLGWLISSGKLKALRSLASLGGLILACGLMSMVFGVLYGSIFGREDILHAVWIAPMENIMTILITAIGFGGVLLSLGFLLGIFNAYRRRDWGYMLANPKGIAGLILYWSLLGLAVGALAPTMMPVPSIIFIVLAAISGFVVMLSEIFVHLISGHRPLLSEGIGTYAVQAFFELFETLVSMLSNTLSYVRVGAFAVAHGFLTTAVYMIGSMFGPEYSIVWWIVAVFGNLLLVVFFEGAIVGIQTMRLEYYEFFSKFFTGGGLRFQPLTVQPEVEK